MQLRHYQKSAVDETYDYWRNDLGDHPIIVAPTASGKSLIIAKMAQDICIDDIEASLWCITHTQELIEQDSDELLGIWPQADVGLYSAGLRRKDTKNQIIFAGIQSIHNKVDLFERPPMVIIVDECFTGDTEILTNKGPTRMDLVKCGDVIYNASGVGIVESISIKECNETYLLEFDDGSKTECTKNHPFFTPRGWIKVEAMEIGENIFSAEGMRYLWENFQALDKNEQWESENSNERSCMEKADELLKILCKEISKSDSKGRVSPKNIPNIEKNWPQAFNTWRERAKNAFSSIGNSVETGERLGARSCCSNKNEAFKKWLSDLLQNRCCEQRKNDWDRNRRSKPPQQKSEIPRQKENGIFGIKRLVNISRVKSESSKPVYNLQISGHPSYFANGALVHNCHMIPKKENTRYMKFFKKVHEISPKTKIVGLTATHYRLDSGYLHEGKGAIFDGISYEIQVKKLIDEGFLCPVISKGGVKKIDLSGVNKRGGEYIEWELAKAASDPELVDSVCEEIIEYGKDRKAWLVFACGVKHAHMIEKRMMDNGIDAAVVSDKTKKKERKKILSDFKEGKLKCLINIGILTTGFNAPICDLIAMVRATMSTALYVQIVGRGMRLFAGKENCLFLDYGNNVLEHGPIDCVSPKVKNSSGDVPLLKNAQLAGTNSRNQN
jgi:superfamily II DNA or RNA helicase